MQSAGRRLVVAPPQFFVLSTSRFYAIRALDLLDIVLGAVPAHRLEARLVGNTTPEKIMFTRLNRLDFGAKNK